MSQKVKVNGSTIEIELDNGASVSVISEKTWKETFPQSKLLSTDVVLLGNGPPLWGRNCSRLESYTAS